MDPKAAFANELRSLLRFKQEAGQIWLGERRMVLLHAEYLQGLRDELVNTLGAERAQGILFRMGFASGRADAALVQDLLPQASLDELMRLGPEIHGLEGLVVGSVEKLDINLAKGQFNAEASWQSSWESEVQLSRFGEAQEPCCYSQTGYASGYVSALVGYPVVFKEVACISCGAERCQIVGREIVAWGADDPWVRLLEPDDMTSELYELRQQVAKLERKLDGELPKGHLVGASTKFHDALKLLSKAARSDITVLLLGETGVGKEAFAKWLHANGARADKPFVVVNCGAIPADLVESELFGAEAGAFTGATTTRHGRFERADGGTIFLDEFGELPPAAQVKLLRVLQEGEVERLGSTKVRKVDVRVIAATNQNLEQAIADRQFRSDLFYRVNRFPVNIAPLRERKADILPLAEAFLESTCQRDGLPVPGISDLAAHALVAHTWPGNVRELQNVIERAALLADPGEQISLDHLGALANSIGQDAMLGADGTLRIAAGITRPTVEALLEQFPSLEDLERALIESALAKARGNIAAAARLVGLTRAQLDYRIKAKAIATSARRGAVR